MLFNVLSLHASPLIVSVLCVLKQARAFDMLLRYILLEQVSSTPCVCIYSVVLCSTLYCVMGIALKMEARSGFSELEPK